MKTELRHVTPKDPEGWMTYHRIRRSMLWDGGRRYNYRCDHPDETADGNFPMLFLVDGEPVGVVRIDLKKKRKEVVFRCVGISISERRKGYGTALMRAAEDFARENGSNTFIAIANPDAHLFFFRLGYNIDGLPDRNPEHLRMTKEASSPERPDPRPRRKNDLRLSRLVLHLSDDLREATMAGRERRYRAAD